jgi:hypothetical protein
VPWQSGRFGALPFILAQYNNPEHRSAFSETPRQQIEGL